MRSKDLKPGQIMVGTFMRKPAKAWRLMGSSQWAMSYLMPDGSVYGPYPCYADETGNMDVFPSHDDIFGNLGYFNQSVYYWAAYHFAMLR